eukprot:GHVH01003643.1.p1 GENE.GHVH01003643.1~~GHVH01003643.1.p1  ORF type:complete len:561 (+),score=111.33 GHVH01003643.1:45-1685(+)
MNVPLEQIPAGMPQVAVDESGRPFILLRDQGDVKRTTGLDAVMETIDSCLALVRSLKSSFGPKGADKIIVSPDGKVTVTNDGATILQKMEVTHESVKLLVELSKSQDEEIGDGTTGVVIFAGALLASAKELLQKGLHPLIVVDGYDKAMSIALKHIEEVAVAKDIDANDNEELIMLAKTTLGSKLIHPRKNEFARICVDAILSVADRERRDVNFELVRVHGKTGGKLEDSRLINGVIVDKDLSHCQMDKVWKNVKVAVLTCPFEPPKPKTKHKLDIDNVADYNLLVEQEQLFFREQIAKLKEVGAEFIVCQWGFDYEANHLLYMNNLPSIRWVGGQEIEAIAVATGAKIVPRFEDLTADKLGFAELIEELTVGTEGEKMTMIECEKGVKTSTILVRGGNSVAIKEAERAIHDALCSIRNLVKCNKVVAGGGAIETSCSLAVDGEANNIVGVEQYAVRAYSEALSSIAAQLADNSGLNRVTVPSEVASRQYLEKNPHIGVDCLGGGVADMMQLGVFESILSKKGQIQLATQVVKMLLRIDDIIDTST